MHRLDTLAPSASGIAFAVLLSLCAASPAIAQEEPASVSGAAPVTDAIQGLAADMETLQEELSSLLGELRSLRDARPARPTLDAPAKKKAESERETRVWMRRLARIRAGIAAAGPRIEALGEALEAQRSSAAAIRPRSRVERARLRALGEDASLLRDGLDRVGTAVEGLADATRERRDVPDSGETLDAATESLLERSLPRERALRRALADLARTVEQVQTRATAVSKG